MLKIYNTLTRKKEEFKPYDSREVKMYTCGVTVYDDCHIGHSRSLYVFEVMRRYLVYKGFRVKFVRNITDVDDKIINKAREVSKIEGINLKKAFDKVRKTYIDSYYKDLKLLGLGKADKEPLATRNISPMQRYIQGLIDKGFAYAAQGNVYFSVRKFPSYGELSNKKIDELLSSVRIDEDPLKKDPLDFALWKKAKPDEPYWPSPWGKGRPGWHIECSVMSQKYLMTDTLDIHGGGRDLVFPHHENELAQSQALTGKPFANYWIHHGLLTINGQKMAKSLGNFVTVRDFMARYRDADLLKLFFLSAHYSRPIDYNEEKIAEVKKQKKSFYDFFDKISLREKGKQIPLSAKDKIKVDNMCIKFQDAMDDDFNTPRALASLFELLDLGSGFVSCDKKGAFNYIKDKLAVFFNILGLKIKPKEKVPPKLWRKIKERSRLRKEKNFKKADQVRKEIEREFPYHVTDSATSTMLVARQLPEEREKK
ncbi:MAG: cysteine--tRNA ligase [Candidatus Omnitrophota bacterium]|nr:MAG: cysteine--tRNA ligase [Candidatus Omnitrophota bacterium]